MSLDAYDGLLKAVTDLGFPEELGAALAAELRGDKSMERMTRYLYAARPDNIEEVVDEMLAIVQMRDRWIEQKKSQWATAKMSEFYNRERDDDEDEPTY
ncbi:MAG: hypothetical protein IJ125_06535 [Atopobiaceae bacterium]|nr:hypothetical protein [Atopobiaceae bacterium]